jgi:hypothetical protein
MRRRPLSVLFLALIPRALGRTFARIEIQTPAAAIVEDGLSTSIGIYLLRSPDVLEPVSSARSFCSELTGVHDPGCVDDVVRGIEEWARSTIDAWEPWTLVPGLAQRGTELEHQLMLAAASWVIAGVTAHKAVRAQLGLRMRRVCGFLCIAGV